jgi:hypothetical protein
MIPYQHLALSLSQEVDMSWFMTLLDDVFLGLELHDFNISHYLLNSLFTDIPKHFHGNEQFNKQLLSHLIPQWGRYHLHQTI